MINNKNKFKSNYDAYHIDTRQKTFNFQQQLSNLSLYQKGVNSNSIKVFTDSHKIPKL